MFVTEVSLKSGVILAIRVTFCYPNHNGNPNHIGKLGHIGNPNHIGNPGHIGNPDRIENPNHIGNPGPNGKPRYHGCTGYLKLSKVPWHYRYSLDHRVFRCTTVSRYHSPS